MTYVEDFGDDEIDGLEALYFCLYCDLESEREVVRDYVRDEIADGLEEAFGREISDEDINTSMMDERAGNDANKILKMFESDKLGSDFYDQNLEARLDVLR